MMPPALRRALTVLSLFLTLPVLGSRAVAYPSEHGSSRISEDLLASEDNPAGERQAEADLALHPTDEDRAVAVVQEGRLPDGGAQAIGFAWTDDGGETWGSGLLPGLTEATGGTYERATDPVVTFGPDGSAYAASLVFGSDDRQAIVVNRTDDGGRTWSDPTSVSAIDSSEAFYDKGWVTVDRTDGPHGGRVYVIWKNFSGAGDSGPLLLSHSDDRALTWAPPITVPAEAGAVGAQALVDPNGVVHLVYHSRSKIMAQRSLDGGTTWTPPRRVAVVDVGRIDGLRTGDFLPSAAVDPIGSRLYVVWQDGRRDIADIYISRSADGGRNWSEPSRVSRHGREVQFTPDVAAYGRRVQVTYYSGRDPFDDPDLYNYFASTSIDAAATFGPPLKLTERSFDMDHATRTTGGLFLGDYMGSALGRDGGYAAWVDTRTVSTYVAGTHQPDLYAERFVSP